MKPAILENEKELLRLVANGNQASYNTIFRHYWDQIYSTALVFTKSPELSEDVAQDVFAQIWIKRGQLEEIERFEAFLYVMARNLIFDRLRKKVFTNENEEYLKSYFKESSYNPDKQLEFKQFEETVHIAISKLPPQQQIAFRLSRFKGLSHEEIASQMGISKQTVKSYIVRAIVNLRQFLEDHPGNFCIAFWIVLLLQHSIKK